MVVDSTVDVDLAAIRDVVTGFPVDVDSAAIRDVVVGFPVDVDSAAIRGVVEWWTKSSHKIRNLKY